MSATAVHAARNARRWGTYAAARYAARRKVPVTLFLLALRLERAQQP
jgi:hypothetical protein